MFIVVYLSFCRFLTIVVWYVKELVSFGSVVIYCGMLAGSLLLSVVPPFFV